MVEVSQNEDFLQKTAFKTAFLADTKLDQLTLEGAGTPNFKSADIFDMFPGNLWGKSFQMSYREARWRQYCPIGGRLKFFTRGTPKIDKNGHFLLFSKLLEILILKHISRVPPCES